MLRRAVGVFFTIFVLVAVSNAGLTGYYYNIPESHPDMQRWVTGLETGYVESTLTGATPTLTDYGNTRIAQWDWWDASYYSMTRVDSDADLQTNFQTSWFPLNEGVEGDPYFFSVHWVGQFYVDESKDYDYHMASDDDSWLFIDDGLVLDLGGVHGLTSDTYTVSLTQGWHDIDIFFAERHTSQSGFRLNFFSDLQPRPSVPEPMTLVLFGTGLVGFGIRRFKKN